MKYNEQVFRDMPSSEKLEIINNELNLATHNATTKADLLMLLGWLLHEYIFEYIFDKWRTKEKWIPVSERLPENEKEVEVSIERRLENGTRRFTCRAIYEDGNIWSESSLYHWEDLDDYDEECGDGKVPQGWYEAATYAEEFVAIGDFVVAWRPLPEPYVAEDNQQKKCPFLGFDGHAICFSEGGCPQEYLAGCPVYVPTD